MRDTGLRFILDEVQQRLEHIHLVRVDRDRPEAAADIQARCAGRPARAIVYDMRSSTFSIRV